MESFDPEPVDISLSSRRGKALGVRDGETLDVGGPFAQIFVQPGPQPDPDALVRVRHLHEAGEAEQRCLNAQETRTFVIPTPHRFLRVHLDEAAHGTRCHVRFLDACHSRDALHPNRRILRFDAVTAGAGGTLGPGRLLPPCRVFRAWAVRLGAGADAFMLHLGSRGGVPCAGPNPEVDLGADGLPIDGGDEGLSVRTLGGGALPNGVDLCLLVADS